MELVYILKNLKVKIRNDANENDDNIESLFVESINRKAKKVVLTVVYIPPKKNFHDFGTSLKLSYLNWINREK